MPPLKLNDPPEVAPPRGEALSATAAWRAGANLKGRRVRVTGRAEAKAGLSGRLVVWFLSDRGRKIIVACLEGGGAEKLRGELVEGAGVADVGWELTVEGVVSRSGSGTVTMVDVQVVEAGVAGTQG